MIEPISLLTMFAPVITDGIRGVVNRFTGGAGAKPANVEEAVKLVDSDIRRLEAISKLDKVDGDVSLWVNNVRALQRPVATAVVLVSWIGLLAVYGNINPQDVIDIVSNLASAVIFYLFGDRTYMHFKSKDK